MIEDVSIPNVESLTPVKDILLIQVFKGKVDNAAGIVSTTQFDYAKIGKVLKCGTLSEGSTPFYPGDTILFRRNLSDPHYLMLDGNVIDCFFISCFDVVAKICDAK